MTDFGKYAALRSAGKSARDVYAQAKDDGVDEITSVRLLREVFGLSLGEAKHVSGASNMWEQPQIAKIGNTVYWEGADTVQGPYVMKAVISDIRDGYAYLADQYRYLVDGHQFIQVPASLDRIPLTYFQKSLVDRLQESSDFWQQIAGLPRVIGHELPVQTPLNPIT